MTPTTAFRLGGFAALAFVVLTVFAAVVPHEALPESAPPAADVNAFFERNAAMQAAQPFTKILGAFAFLGFAAVVSLRLREAGAGFAASLVLAGGTLFVTVVVTAMILVASIVTLAPAMDGGVIYVAYNISWIANVRSGLAAVPFLLAAGIGIVATRALPRATGYGAVAAALVALAGGAAALAVPGPNGIGPAFLGFLAVVAWTLATGVVMLVKASSAPAPRATRAAEPESR